MLNYVIYVLFVFCHFQLVAVDYSPWYGNIYEINGHVDLCLETYCKVDTEDCVVKQSTVEGTCEIGASFVPLETYSAEFDVVFGSSRYRPFSLDAILLTAKKLWLDDIIGDPLSVSTGLSVSQIFKPGLRDLSLFYHGGIQGEVHVALGQEIPCMEFWRSRGVCVLGLGIADIGYPWIRGDVVWMHNWWDLYDVSIFANTFWGLGNKGLHVEHFHGYGSVRHQSVDVGVSYGFQLESGLKINGVYSYRCFARNCPANVSRVMVEFLYSFGL